MIIPKIVNELIQMGYEELTPDQIDKYVIDNSIRTMYDKFGNIQHIVFPLTKGVDRTTTYENNIEIYNDITDTCYYNRDLKVFFMRINPWKTN